MTTENIKEYLEMVLDMEKNKYIQENVLQRIENEIDSLGHKRSYDYPTKGYADVSFGLYIGVTAIILGFLGFIINMVSGFESSDGLLDSFSALFDAVGSAFIWALIGAVIGLVIALIKKASEQSEYNAHYEQSLQRYNAQVDSDDARVEDELKKRAGLVEEYKTLYSKYEESCDKLEEFYSYNIIDCEYRGFVAVASLYQYFSQQRTYSLGFDPKTGDQGAYNIYQNERRQNIIIDKLDIIAEKLDTVIENQRVIAHTLKEANTRINSLSKSIKSGFRKMESAINNQTAVLEYNAERDLAEKRYLNTLATWSYIDNQRK